MNNHRGLHKIQFPLIISPREARGETGLPSQRHGVRLKKDIIEFLEPLNIQNPIS